MSTHAWTVAEAQAKFSELIEKAKSEGPQEITKPGRIRQRHNGVTESAPSVWSRNVELTSGEF